ncbi:MAG: DegT/DnrJ/EryC1/StrS family aminotransferase [Bryobacteraceae bacterium]|jgi:dTDP-4-amino-4,6-dideoxygalactose transaminase
MQDLAEIIREHKLAVPVYVTQPVMPKLEGYVEHLAGIWERKWLTNDGPLHQEFERRLSEYVDADHVSVFCNATIALMVALETLRIDSGEVITTPFTFPATSHVLYWNRVRPVFCDIDPVTMNLDPSKIERLISPETKAILPVHVYGRPCDVETIQRIAEIHGLHVIYDAAHAFAVRHKGKSILAYGDISVLSFHATKLFTTIEGGALISRTDVQRKRVNFLKNFGIADEETVVGPGINGKMNEFQAAFGLMQLQLVDGEIHNRREIALIYREALRHVAGITVLEELPDTESNYAYFPILIETEDFGMSRDDLFVVMRHCNVFARKYFYPLISHASCYSALPSAAAVKLPVAERVATQVICLPIYGSLEHETARTICRLIAACAARRDRHAALAGTLC